MSKDTGLYAENDYMGRIAAFQSIMRENVFGLPPEQVESVNAIVTAGMIGPEAITVDRALAVVIRWKAGDFEFTIKVNKAGKIFTDTD